MEARWCLVGPSPIVCLGPRPSQNGYRPWPRRRGSKSYALGWKRLASPGGISPAFGTETPVLTQANPTIYVFNPAWVQGLKRVYADAGKTDRLDAFFIAERLRVGRLPTPFQPDLVYAP